MLNESVPKSTTVNNTGNTYHHHNNKNHMSRNYPMANHIASAPTIATTPLPTNNHTYPANVLPSANPQSKERTVKFFF
jgi:hypothetical protein